MIALDTLILGAFRDAAGRHLALSELAETTGGDPAEILRRLGVLREAGFEIEEHPHLGCRIVSRPDRLIADDIQAGLGSGSIGGHVLVFAETTSTNDVAMRLGNEGGAHGTVVFAEAQTGGRGRLGRAWHSARGQGLWFSVLLRPDFPAALWPRLASCTALAVATGIERTVPVAARIKWPNDVLIGGRKVAGILLESRIDSDASGHVVLGVGLNVNQEVFPGDLSATATSLRLATGNTLHDRTHIAIAILDRLRFHYDRILDRFDAVVGECLKRSTLVGQPVELAAGNIRIRGIAESLDPEGSLVLRLPDGGAFTAGYGEITVHPAPGV